jgi:hypothetical protein
MLSFGEMVERTDCKRGKELLVNWYSASHVQKKRLLAGEMSSVYFRGRKGVDVINDSDLDSNLH